MRFIHFSDLHIKRLSLSGLDGWGRINQCHYVLKQVAQRSQEDDIDFVLFCGDLFHDKKPDLDIFESTMALLASKPFRAKPWYFVAGQHDWREQPLGASNYDLMICMIDESQNSVYDNFHFFVSTRGITVGDVLILGVPYQKRMQEEIALCTKTKVDGPAILAIHTPIKDYPIHPSHFSQTGLTIEELCVGQWKYVAAGDFHEPKISYYQDKKVVMSGSPIQHSFGESINGHGYYIVDTKDNSSRKVNFTWYDKMISIVLDSSTNGEMLEKLLSVFRNPNIIFRFCVFDRSAIPIIEDVWGRWKINNKSNKGYKIQLMRGEETLIEMNETAPDMFNLKNEIEKSLKELGLSNDDYKAIHKLSKEICDRAGVV